MNVRRAIVASLLSFVVTATVPGIGLVRAQTPLPSPEIRYVAEPSGPWGKIESLAITLDPPKDGFAHPVFQNPQPWWGFPDDWDSERILALLVGSGANLESANALLDGLQRHEPGIARWFKVPPTLPFQLTDEGRTRLYQQLGQWPFNHHQHSPFVLGAETVASLGRLAPHEFPESVIQRADRLLIHDQGKNLLPDFAAIANELPDVISRVRLGQLLMRTRARLARLHLPVAPGAEAEAFRDYWSAAERNLGALPLIESLLPSAGEESPPLDLIHLLPPLARSLAGTYPTKEQHVARRSPDCFWTARNFFLEEPSQRYLDETSEDTHFQGWKPVSAPYQLGDVILIVDREDETQLRHACNYVAADLVFTKNGISTLRPWVLQRMDEMLATYHRDTHTRVIHLRHRRAVQYDEQRSVAPPGS